MCNRVWKLCKMCTGVPVARIDPFDRCVTRHTYIHTYTHTHTRTYTYIYDIYLLERAYIIILKQRFKDISDAPTDQCTSVSAIKETKR